MANQTIEDLRKAAKDAADENGMCTVVATIDGVTDNGHTYAEGQEFHMHKDLVPPHAQAGQVKLAKASGKGQTTPKDKQMTGSKDK